MRPSTIWFALAIAWALDTLLALFHRNWPQVALTALFACAFMAIGLVFKSREKKTPTHPKRPVRNGVGKKIPRN